MVGGRKDVFSIGDYGLVKLLLPVQTAMSDDMYRQQGIKKQCSTKLMAGAHVQAS